MRLHFLALTVDRNLWPLWCILWAAIVSYKMALVATGGNKFCSMEGCTAWIEFNDGFSAGFVHMQLIRFDDHKQLRSQPSVFFISQPTGMTTMQCWQCWQVTNKGLDDGLRTRVVLTIEETVLGYFDHWPAAKNLSWPLTARWLWSQLWLQGIQ